MSGPTSCSSTLFPRRAWLTHSAQTDPFRPRVTTSLWRNMGFPNVWIPSCQGSSVSNTQTHIFSVFFFTITFNWLEKKLIEQKTVRMHFNIILTFRILHYLRRLGLILDSPSNSTFRSSTLSSPERYNHFVHSLNHHPPHRRELLLRAW